MRGCLAATLLLASCAALGASSSSEFRVTAQLLSSTRVEAHRSLPTAAKSGTNSSEMWFVLQGAKASRVRIDSPMRANVTCWHSAERISCRPVDPTRPSAPLTILFEY